MFRVKAEPSNEFKRHLEQYGPYGISKIYICREPIAKGVELFLDAVTLGKYSNTKKDLHYDTVFHLYLMIMLHNGMWMLFEKNEQPVLKPSDRNKVEDFEHVNVFVEPNSITLEEFVNNAIHIMGNNEFFIYDGITSNCQKFVTDVLTANNLWNTKYDLFVNQNINESLKEVKGLKGIMRKITDVGAIANRLMGKGKKQRGGTDETFHPTETEKHELERAFNSLDRIEIRNLRNEQETKRAHDEFVKANNTLNSILRRRNLRDSHFDEKLVNSRGGFGYLPSFDDDIDKDNKENVKRMIVTLKKNIKRLIKYNNN